MIPTAPSPLQQTVAWLATYARFPTTRLDARAELLVCGATLAAAEEEEERRRFLIERRDPAQTSALKAHAMRRSQVHYKCDNSAKV